MRTQITVLGILISLAGAPAWAGQKEVMVAVKGMVCGFCAQGIEKKFKSESAVDKIKVSLGEKRVKLTLKDGQNIADEKIKTILAESGYNVEKIERN
jgi:copper chaperone CopZ